MTVGTKVSGWLIVLAVVTCLGLPADCPAQIKLLHVEGEKLIDELARLSKELGLEKQVNPGEAADMTSFAYDMALQKLGTRFLSWSSEIRNETVVSLYLMCPVIKYANLPENREGYREQVVKVRRLLYSGAFDKLVSRLAIRPRYFTLTYPAFVSAKPQTLMQFVEKPENVFDLTLLENFSSVRDAQVSKFR